MSKQNWSQHYQLAGWSFDFSDSTSSVQSYPNYTEKQIISKTYHYNIVNLSGSLFLEFQEIETSKPANKTQAEMWKVMWNGKTHQISMYSSCCTYSSCLHECVRVQELGGWGEINAVKILSKMIHEVPACTEHILVSGAERICDRRAKVIPLVSWRLRKCF